MRSCTWPRFSFFLVRVSIMKSLSSTLSCQRGSRCPDGRELNLTAEGLFRSGLSNFLLEALARIAHALVLVRIGWTQGPHFGGDLSYLLPVNSRQRDACLLRIDCRIHSRG